MAKQKIHHGAEIDTLTPEEAVALIRAVRADGDQRTRVRASATVKLDATGNGQDEVYIVPTGFEFEARRITVDLDTASDPSSGNVALNVAGKAVELLRGGTRIEYLVPISPNATPQVPGVQTWGKEQGPYFRNSEAVEVKARGLTANATLDVTVEGILRRPEQRPGK